MNEDLVATGGEDCSVRLWAMESVPATEEGPATMICNHQNTIKAHAKSVWTVKFTPDGQLLVSGSSDCDIRLWSIESSKRATLAAHFVAHDSWVRSVCWSSGSEMLITASTDGIISLWSTPKRFHASSARSARARSMLLEEQRKTMALVPLGASQGLESSIGE
jgi:WD40 repeat protein